MQHLFDLASELGVKIEYTDLTHLDRDGDYCHRTRTIRLQRGMLRRLEVSVLAHELAHAINGDQRTMFDYYDDKDERRADEWAALLLIDIDEYRYAEEKYGNDREHIAQELGVMDFIVEAFERTLTRIGDTVYVQSKQGAGQWAQKVRVA